MAKDGFRGVRWTIENFSYWNRGIPPEKSLRSPEFHCRGHRPHSIQLNVRDSRGIIMVNLLGMTLPGHLSFLAADGSLICSLSVDDDGLRPLRGPSFQEVVAQNNKCDSDHQDRLTLRWQVQGCSTVVHLRTTITVYEFAVNITPERCRELGKSTEIATVNFPHKNDNSSLSVQVEKYNYFILVAQDEPTLLVSLRAHVHDGHGRAVRTVAKEYLCQRMRKLDFPYPATREEVEDKGCTVLFCVKIAPCSDYSNKLVLTCKTGVDVTSPQLCSADDSNGVVTIEFDESVKQLVKDLACVYQDQDHSDIELKCGDISIPAHKVILSARSPVFKTMLSCGMREATSNVVDITDIDPSTLSLFLTFLYKGAVDDLQCDSALKLYYAADKYQVPSLKKKCSNLLAANVSFSNLCDVLSLADRHQDRNLTSAAHDFFLENFNQVLASEEWKSFMQREPLLAVGTLTHFGEKNLVVTRIVRMIM